MLSQRANWSFLLKYPSNFTIKNWSMYISMRCTGNYLVIPSTIQILKLKFISNTRVWMIILPWLCNWISKMKKKKKKGQQVIPIFLGGVPSKSQEKGGTRNNNGAIHLLSFTLKYILDFFSEKSLIDCSYGCYIFGFWTMRHLYKHEGQLLRGYEPKNRRH